MSYKPKLLITLSLLAMLLLISACNNQSEPPLTTPIETHQDEHDENTHPEKVVKLTAIELAEGEQLKVVVTTNIVSDLVHNIGGDKIALTTMLPVGADPHTYVPTPQDIAAVSDAHVVFINGLQLEEFLTELISKAGSETPIVALSTNVNTREFEGMNGTTHGEEGHAHSRADPHIWLTPANAVVMVENIEHALGELDPTNAIAYQANATTYRTQLAELETWVMEQIAAIPPENRKMVTDHDAFGYYSDHYGLEIIGTVIPAYSTNAEPSAQEFADLQETIKLTEAKAIFVGTTTNPTLAQRISEDIGIELVPLYTGSLSETGQGVDTYLNFIRYNTTAIVEALKLSN